MAGMVGIEPTDQGVKTPCLTSWLHPNMNPTGIAPGHQWQVPVTKDELFLLATAYILRSEGASPETLPAMVLKVGLEPTRLAATDFESAVSAYSIHFSK